MKHKFSLIWRVAVALVLVLSFSLVAAVPVAAAPDVSNVWVQLTGTTPYNADKTEVTYNVYFTPGADLAKGVDTVSVLFPSAVGGTIGTSDVKVDSDGDGVTKIGVSATAVTSASTSSLVVCTIPVDLEAGTEALISIAKVTNPAAGAKTLKVRTSQETTWAESSSYIIGAGLVTGVDFTPTTLTAGIASEYTITFNSTRALVGGLDTITVIFPTGTTVPSSIAKAHVKEGGTVVTSVAATALGRFVTVTVPTDITAGAGVSLVFDATSGIYNGTLATDTTAPDGTQNDLLHLGEYVGKVYTNRDSAIVSDSSHYDIQPGPVSKLGFGATLTGHKSATLVEKNKVSGDIYVQTQDQYGNLKKVTPALSVTLSSDTTGTATFSANPVVIGDNLCEADFTYQDTAAGTWTITASPPSGSTITAATWEIKVEEAHVIALYDATGELVDDTYTTIQAAINDAFAGYTVKVDPGTYAESLGISTSKITLESTAGAASTIIQGEITIAGAGDNFVLGGAAGKGFTLKGSAILVRSALGASDVTISYNTFDLTGTGTKGILIQTADCSGWTVTENAFTIVDKLDQGIYGAMESSISGLTVTNNTFTGTDNTLETSGIEICSPDITSISTTISGNTITATEKGVVIGRDQAAAGLVTTATAAGTLKISGNTFDGLKWGLEIINAHAATDTDQNLVVVGNTFSNNEYAFTIDYGKYPMGTDYLEPDDFAVKYNNFSGSSLYGLYNNVTAAVAATHNWWGDATGPSGVGSGSGDAVSADVTYDPWLGTSVSAAATATNAASLDAQSTVGVKVSGVNSKDIGVARYTENPVGTPEFTPIDNGFFDVYVNDPAATSTEIGIRFYDAAITSDSTAYVWDAFEEMWKLCTEQSTISGMVWVKARPYSATVPAVPTIQDLAGTPFAISTEEAPPEDILAYYRAYSGDPEVVETTDLLKAANDWANEVVPPDFTESISTTQLLELANEWAATE